jgi:hypothetical protein
MPRISDFYRRGGLLLAGAIAVVFAGCGSKEPPGPAATPPAATTASAGDEAPATVALATLLSPEALEDLLAPIALYPDVVLGHVLAASTNPQEVLDAGNWLLQNPDLSGKELDEAAEQLGLSTSMRALLQFPEVVDMMCMKLDWTTELGEAFTADQGAVLDSVQRLRKQAQDVGNLASSEQLKVATEVQEDKEVITVSPPKPEVVYVPTYDPAAVYAPPPATIPPPTTAPATTTTESAEKGHSTGTLITTGLLAFGAGILVNEIFDDDDDWDDYYPHYGYGGVYYGGHPYYPPPPYMYRPPYGGGYYPSHGYTRPPNYQHGFNNNTIIINNGGNDYWNRYDGKPGRTSAQPKSPITAARPNRPELTALNQQSRERAERIEQRPAASARPADRAGATDAKPQVADRSKVQGEYAGARPEGKEARDKMVAARPAGDAASARPASKAQGSYAGARPGSDKARTQASVNAKAASEKRVPTREGARPAAAPTGTVDRGRPAGSSPQEKAARPAQPQSKPAVRPAPSASSRSGGAFASGGGNDRAASQRGRQSMPTGSQPQRNRQR